MRRNQSRCRCSSGRAAMCTITQLFYKHSLAPAYRHRTTHRGDFESVVKQKGKTEIITVDPWRSSKHRIYSQRKDSNFRLLTEVLRSIVFKLPG